MKVGVITMTVFKNKETGRWEVYARYKNYKNEIKQKRKTGFERRKDAQQWEEQFLNKCQHDLTLEMALEEYLTYMQLKRRSSTWRNKKWYSKNLLLMKDLFIEDITPATILAWQNDLKSMGKTNNTINMSTEILYSIYQYNCKMHNKQYNPVQAIERLEVDKKEMQIWTVEEFNKFTALLPSHEQVIAFRILFYSGIRYGELLGLTIEDIHDDYIDINKSYDYRDKMHVKTKNKQSIRKVYMPKIIMNEIRDYISTFYKPTPALRLFQHSTNTWLQSQMKRTCAKHHLKRIRVHDLRHSHASMLINNGVDVYIVSKRLGHKNILTTINVYSHLYEERETEVLEVLDSLVENE